MTSEVLRDGRFVVLAPIGEGSQGRTFDGFDRKEGRPIAIKRFDVRGASSWKDVELAEREARVLQSLRHPKLPAYVDHFEHDGALYLVMEKIEGESLAALRKRGASLGERDVLRLLADANDVLTYLHGRAPPVIHRDIKPGNVIRRPDGSFAFVDFGAVRDKLRPEGGSTVVGTFGFMAPEQFQGRALPASDVYAIGATALSMLTGQAPEDLPHKGLAIDVRAATHGLCSAKLIGILERMLDPDPDRRATSIAPLLAGGGGPGRPPRRGRPEPRSPSDTWQRHAEEAATQWQRQAEHAAAHLQDALSRGARRRARREARRRERQERRHARMSRGAPFPFSLLFGIAFAVAMIAVSATTQVVVPLVLTILSIFFARRALREAAHAVRQGGRTALDNIDRSRRWLAGDPPGQDDPGMRVDAGADPGGPHVRVGGDSGAGDDRDEDDEDDTGSSRRRRST